MSIWDKMQELTSNKNKEVNDKIEAEHKELTKAKVGDIIQGVITELILGDGKDKKGGYGFIASEQLPYERIFFHWSGLSQDSLRFPELKRRMKVEFKLQWDDFRNSFKAIKIKVLG